MTRRKWILSTMTITEERDLEIDFYEPYYVANGDVLVLGGFALLALLLALGSCCAHQTEGNGARRMGSL